MINTATLITLVLGLAAANVGTAAVISTLLGNRITSIETQLGERITTMGGQLGDQIVLTTKVLGDRIDATTKVLGDRITDLVHRFDVLEARIDSTLAEQGGKINALTTKEN